MSMKTNKIVSMKVAPEYRKIIKFEAMKLGCSILEYSRKKSKEMEGKNNGFKIGF